MSAHEDLASSSRTDDDTVSALFERRAASIREPAEQAGAELTLAMLSSEQVT